MPFRASPPQQSILIPVSAGGCSCHRFKLVVAHRLFSSKVELLHGGATDSKKRPVPSRCATAGGACRSNADAGQRLPGRCERVRAAFENALDVCQISLRDLGDRVSAKKPSWRLLSTRGQPRARCRRGPCYQRGGRRRFVIPLMASPTDPHTPHITAAQYPRMCRLL